MKVHLGRRLPYYMVPVHLVQLDRMPLTPNGKLDRKQLPDPGSTGQDNHQPPSTETEQKLAGLWAEALALDAGTMDVNSDLFRLGGHSIHAVKLVNRIERTFGLAMPLKIFLNLLTIREIAKYVDSFTPVAKDTTLAPNEEQFIF